MRLSGITPESVVDGPGLRYVIFTQGCQHYCPMCHNQESWDMEGGREFSIKQIIRMIKKQKKTQCAELNGKLSSASQLRGITFSGGEPFLQAGELSQIAFEAHQIGYDVVTYTGFTYEELLDRAENDSCTKELLSLSDILIDGKFVNELKTTKLPFRGSSNQRIIDMVKTRVTNKIVLWHDDV